jgi:hypothetical protein
MSAGDVRRHSLFMGKMKTHLKHLLAVLVLVSAERAALAQPTAFTYQGLLEANGAPANGSFDLVFSLFTTNSGGSQVGGTITNAATAVSNGAFTVALNFGAGIFTGAEYWLQIGVRPNGGTGAFTLLAPLQEVTPAPSAIVANAALSLAGALPGNLLSGTYGDAVTLTNSQNHFSGDGSGLTGVDAASLGGVAAASFWNIAGNKGTNPQSNNFLGTLDNQPLELHVNGTRAFRLEPAANSPNVIGGSSNNAVATGVYSAAIGGGISNLVASGAFESTIAGGNGNVIDIDANDSAIGGGSANDIGPGADSSTIAGGVTNAIQKGAFESAIGGGNGNFIETNATDCVIAGGYFNSAAAPYSVVSGGQYNATSGYASSVPGGAGNSASGDYSFAAGSGANATNDGAFVWADSLPYVFSSSADNEFAARATGGARFVSAVNTSGTPTAGVVLAAGGGSWSSLSDHDSKENFAAVDAQDILRRLCAVPVSTWNYKSQPPATRHIGPMAQDFAQAFAVGEDNRHITGIDADGVALAAIQGLNEKLEAALRKKNDEIEKLKKKAAKVDLLEDRLNQLEQSLQFKP